MANKANKDFYYNLLRKELQSLCKRYGLPANKSHSDLAKSLVAHLEGGNEFPWDLCYVSTQEGFGGPMYNLWDNFHAQFNGSGLSHNESQRKYSGENCLGLEGDRTMESVPEIECGEINASACPAQAAIGCSVGTPTKIPSPSFEFHVRSEEGINLYVDLNSSLSEWTKRFKKEVCICENVHSNKSLSLHQDLGCVGKGDTENRNSFLQNMGAGKNDDGHVLTKRDHVELDQPVKVDGTLVTSAVRSWNVAVDASEHLTEDEALISSKLESAAQTQIISGAHSYAKDGCALMLDSNVFNSFQKSMRDSVVNSISEDQLSHVPMEHQNSKLQNGYNHVNLSVVYPGSSTSASMEMQLSEAVSCHEVAPCLPCGNGRLVAPFDPKDNTDTESCGLVRPCELDPGMLGNYVAKSAEEWEKSNITNGRESPECSQITGSVETNCFYYDNLESNEELSRKRKHIEGEHQSGYGNPDAKILTSTKHITRKVLPRRSVRLTSKGAHEVHMAQV